MYNDTPVTNAAEVASRMETNLNTLVHLYSL